ncbi:hypothetical protein OH76DRAFT_847061 [Lentinus brumalis]|uniref:Uncharacterized protein n=1 Tax=Lentinus brumalis TaxID=2498619 RepID=A0A371DQS6_9APHY|nr:hypothetical protein OH76DRAFT_847061 [Polyporus brumalis]
MIDPSSAAAATNGIVTVLVFLGSQLSPSVMTRRAVKKELKVAALLKESGAIISAEDWAKLDTLEKMVEHNKLGPDDTAWGNIIKKPIGLLLQARRYHSAADKFLFETRVASARAVVGAARAASAAGQGEENVPSSPDTASFDLGADPGSYDITSPGDTYDNQTPAFDSTAGMNDSLTTYFENVTVLAGDTVRITLHFSVCDVPVTIKPHEHLVNMPAWYDGPLVLAGYARLIPCNPSDDPLHMPEIVAGYYNQGYDLEFPEIYWSVPQDHLVRVSSFADDDSVSVASLEATYGGDRETFFIFDEDERVEKLEMLRRRAGLPSR